MTFAPLPTCHHPVSVSFHSPLGVLFSFPSRYSCAIGLRLYLGLGVSPPIFTPDRQRALLCLYPTNSHPPTRLSLCVAPLSSGLRTIELVHSTNHIRLQLPRGVQFASHPRSFALLTEYLLVSFPAGTKIFQFPAYAFAPCGANNSGIPGSKVACTYPGLIAACHALHRILSLAIHWTVVTIPYPCLNY